MIRRRFSQVDVFAGSSFRGNPVAVVHEADDLTDVQMQRIARWTNLSETTFLLQPTDPDADYRVRIFTGSGELPFAGHPTLGSCQAWMDAHPGVAGHPVVQQCGIGSVRIRRDGDRLAFAAPAMINTGPADEQTIAELADGLRIDPAEIEAARLIDNGPGWTGLLLSSAEAVLAVDAPRLSRPVGLIGRRRSGDPYAIEVRAFVPGGGVTVEDPVTGSLNASAAQWLIGAGVLTAPYLAHQGTAVGADGVIAVDQDPDGTVWVGGGATTMIDGWIEHG